MNNDGPAHGQGHDVESPQPFLPLNEDVAHDTSADKVSYATESDAENRGNTRNAEEHSLVMNLESNLSDNTIKTQHLATTIANGEAMKDQHDTPRTGEKTGLPKLYTLKDVFEHNKPNDMWLVIDNEIYDVSKFQNKHPGGAKSKSSYSKSTSEGSA